MRMAAHVHELALKHVARVARMRRIDERVLRSIDVVRVVALNSLVQKRQADEEDESEDEDQTWSAA